MMPVGRALAKTGITPNMITGLTVLVALVTAYIFYLGDLILGLVLMIFTVVLDMFDGAVARAANLASPFGATLDHTLDRYAEWLFMLGLMIGPGASTVKYIPWFWGFFSLFGMLMASFARAKAESVGGMDSCTVGIAERQEKLLLIAIGILLLNVNIADGWMGYSALVPTFFIAIELTNILALCVAIVGLLSHITVIQRLAYARKMIPHPQYNEEESTSQ
jgi:CDP-diacylglycerol--glycerol-3-phosphate 3-phosphatidyltransferase/archaetidylinositol phosphate synthase